MNKDRRERLQTLYDLLEEIIDEEQNAFDNMPETLQGSERGEKKWKRIYWPWKRPEMSLCRH
jgi:hypothetical protein